MQTQWPALGPTIDFSSLDASGGWGGANPLTRGAGPFAADAVDAVARPWWTCGTAAATQPGGAFGSGTRRRRRVRDPVGPPVRLAAARRHVAQRFRARRHAAESRRIAETAARRPAAALRKRRRELDRRSAHRRSRDARWSGRRPRRGRALGQHDRPRRSRPQQPDRGRLPRLDGGHTARRQRHDLQPVRDRAYQLRSGRGHDEPRRLLHHLRQPQRDRAGPGRVGHALGRRNGDREPGRLADRRRAHRQRLHRHDTARHRWRAST